MPTLPTDNGGYTYTPTGSSGYWRTTQGIPQTGGASIIGDIPTFQRDWNIRDALIHKVQEGRNNFSRLLMDYARENGAYVVTDVNHRWFIEQALHNRFYVKAGTKILAGSTSKITLESAYDVKRLQKGDMLVLTFMEVALTRDGVSTCIDYATDVTSGTTYYKKHSTSKPLMELCEISEVDYTSGTITVKRNLAGDSVTATTGGAVTIGSANVTTDPGASTINPQDAFFLKAGNAMAEGRNDQRVWTMTNTWDYNVAQFVVRKWGWTDIQQNIARVGQPELQSQRNRRLANDAFWDEIEYLFMYGIRKETTDDDGRWKGYMGGALEFIPSGHIVSLDEPAYSSIASGGEAKLGDFNIPYFNKVMEDKFYYGAQQKILLCGARFHTAFSTMLNLKTNYLPMVTDKWSVKGTSFETSNGGSILVVPSDKMSLNGMDRLAVLMDRDSFHYGHLQNMDINVYEDQVDPKNPHESSGEISGVVTMKRINPDSLWLFQVNPGAI